MRVRIRDRTRVRTRDRVRVRVKDRVRVGARASWPIARSERVESACGVPRLGVRASK